MPDHLKAGRIPGTMDRQNVEHETAGAVSAYAPNSTDRWIASVVGLVVLLAGVAASRSYVRLPLDGVVGQLNLIEMLVILAGVTATWRLARLGRLRGVTAAGWAVLFLAAADLIVIMMSLVAGYADAAAPVVTASTLLIGVQHTLAGIGVLAVGALLGIVDRKKAMAIVGIATIIAMVVGILQTLSHGEALFHVLEPLRRFDVATNPIHAMLSRPSGLDRSANAFGAMGAFCIAIALAGMRGSKWRPYALVCAIVIVFISSSRGAMLAAVGAAAVYAILAWKAGHLRNRESGRSWLYLVLIAVAIVIATQAPLGGRSPVAARVLNTLDRATDSGSQDSGIDGRLAAWKTATTVIREAPLGTQTLSVIVMQGPIDNEFLERTMRGGPGLVGAFLLMLWWLAFRLKTQDGAPLGPALAVCTALLAVSMSPTIIPGFFVFAMLAIGTELGATGNDGIHGPPRGALLVAGLAGLAALTAFSIARPAPILEQAAAYDDRLADLTRGLVTYRSILEDQVRERRDGPRTAYPETVLAFVKNEEPPISRTLVRTQWTMMAAETIAAREAAESEDWAEARTHLEAARAAGTGVSVIRWP